MHYSDIDGHAALVDSEICDRFVPFNATGEQWGLVYTYTPQNADRQDEVNSLRFGFVDKFSPSGKLLRRLESGP